MENSGQPGRRNSPVGGLQAALGGSRSPRGIPEASQQQNALEQSSAAALPIIPESSTDPAHSSHPTLQTSQPVTWPSGGQPAALLQQQATAIGAMGTHLPALMPLPQQRAPPSQPYSLPNRGQISAQQPAWGAGALPPSIAGGTGPTPGGGASSATCLVPLRGSLAKGAAAAAAAADRGLPPGQSDSGGAGGAPMPIGHGPSAQYSSTGVLAAPPLAVAAPLLLSSSLSDGVRQGLPSWLQEAAVQTQQDQPHAQAQPQPQLLRHPYPQHTQPPQQQTQTQQTQPTRSAFPTASQRARSPFAAGPFNAGALAAAAAAAQQPHLARSLPASGGLREQGQAQAMAPQAMAPPYYVVTRTAIGAAGHGQVQGQVQGLREAGPGPTAALLRQDSSDEGGATSDTPTRPPLSRGRSEIPKVPSISEIEPVVETEDPARQRLSSSSLLTRAISIPNAQCGDRPRTYRVALAKSQGSQDDVTVVLEGTGGGGSGSTRGGRGGGGGSTHGGSHYSCGSSGGGGGGGGAVLGAGGALSTSMLSPSFLGGLFGSRMAAGGGWGRTGGGLITPDVSVHGADALPFAGRDRYYYHGTNSDLPTTPFGSLPTTTNNTTLRSRANASVGSILNTATGGLNTANTKAMKRSISYQQFGSTALTAGGGGGASGLPSSSSGAGQQQPYNSLNGGSDSSSGAYTASAGAGGGLGYWLRGGGCRGGGGGGSRGGGPGGAGGGGAGSDSDGTVVRAVAGPQRRAEPDLADLAVLATSLPASLGTWSLPRSVALASSPAAAGNGSVRGGSAYYGAGGGRGGGLSRADSGASANVAGGGASAAAAGPSGGFPICLICLEVLTPEDFERGDAISLQCACKGEVALRHRKCAIEWSHHKGDVICDICKQFILNLPPIPPEVLEAREAARRRRQPAFNTHSEPNFGDYCFDCIRGTWVTTIICVLFLGMNVGQAFLLGSLAGMVCTLVSMCIATCMAREVARVRARAVERAAAESRAEEQQQRQRQQQQWQQMGAGTGTSASGLGSGGDGPSPGSAGGYGGSEVSRQGQAASATGPGALTVPLLAAADAV